MGTKAPPGLVSERPLSGSAVRTTYDLIRVESGLSDLRGLRKAYPPLPERSALTRPRRCSSARWRGRARPGRARADLVEQIPHLEPFARSEKLTMKPPSSAGIKSTGHCRKYIITGGVM